jgi:hypothetical protein
LYQINTGGRLSSTTFQAISHAWACVWFVYHTIKRLLRMFNSMIFIAMHLKFQMHFDPIYISSPLICYMDDHFLSELISFAAGFWQAYLLCILLFTNIILHRGITIYCTLWMKIFNVSIRGHDHHNAQNMDQ